MEDMKVLLTAEDDEFASEDLMEAMEERLGSNYLFVRYAVSRWNGVSRGYDAFYSFKQFFARFTDIYSWQLLEDENGCLKFEAQHHDGGYSCDLFIIGREMFNDYGADEYSGREVIEDFRTVPMTWRS